ncbi:MAG: FkbM family methyltransferase [Pseudolabrys sp.]
MLTDKIYHALVSLPKAKRQFARVVRRLPHRLRIVEHHGQRLIIDPSEISGFYLYYEQSYDDIIFKFLDTVIGRYSQALDIDANFGVYTCFFAARVPRVIAFEPDAIPNAWLKRNLALNHFGNVVVEALCIGRSTGMVKFAIGSDARNSGVGSTIDADASSVEYPASSLDDFFAEPLGRCLIKMDIEGAEWDALQGARRLLDAPEASIDILLELHPDYLRKLGVGVRDIRTYMAELGYVSFGIGPQGLIPLREDETEERFLFLTRNTR